MSYKTLKFEIRGVAPLLMHSGQLSDPLNDWSRAMKRVTGKRVKTEADYAELARLEWYGSLYLENGQPCIPGHVLEAAIVTAARKNKQGKQAQAGIICPKNYALRYKDEGSLEELWSAKNHRLTVSVRIGTNRVMRTRPMFDDWSADIEVMYDPSQLNEQDVCEMVTVCGDMGLMDWRPKFGRFEVVG